MEKYLVHDLALVLFAIGYPIYVLWYSGMLVVIIIFVLLSIAAFAGFMYGKAVTEQG